MLLPREAAPAPFATLLDADSLALTAPRLALERTRRLLELDSAGRAGDPFFRAALHLLRAEWYAADGDRGGAAKELLWYGSYDVVDQRDRPSQSTDVDWALGTLARWRRARLAYGDSGRDLCNDLADVSRLWAHGDARYRARADSARARSVELRCSSTS
jgi:hypothetical protein